MREDFEEMDFENTMQRDIKLNMSNLRAILAKVNAYKEELEQIETASAKFLEVIKEQDSKAYDRLSGLWEENVTQNESDLKEKLAIISELLNNYIVGMESYIMPKDSGTMVRVDRNDIWWNYKQIAQRIPYAPEFEEIQSDVFSSLADYKKCFVYNLFEDEGANSARKAAQQAEEESERKRREYNYEQLESFREVLRGKLEGSFKQSVEKIHRMYEDAIVPFENTDDEYKKKLDFYYDEWAGAGDKFADVGNVVKNVGLGVWDGLADLVLGILRLLKSVGEVILWLALQNPVTSYFGFMPEFLEEDMGELWSGVNQLLKDPGNIVEAIGQSTFDTVDEKGIAYSVSYVTADVVVSLLLEKGLGKLGALGKADDVAGAAGDVAKYTDEVAEAANKAGKHADDMAKATKETAEKAVSESGSTSPKGLIGHNFEDYLTKNIGGDGSFSVGGRDFDGGIGNRWWEAKSGGYWEILESNPNKLAKFKSDMGDRLRIATENGATYELFSNSPIPASIKQWLDKKGIAYTELLD